MVKDDSKKNRSFLAFFKLFLDHVKKGDYVNFMALFDGFLDAPPTCQVTATLLLV